MDDNLESKIVSIILKPLRVFGSLVAILVAIVAIFIASRHYHRASPK